MGGEDEGSNSSLAGYVKRSRWNSSSSTADLPMGRTRVDSTTSSTAFFSNRRRTLSTLSPPDTIELAEEPSTSRDSLPPVPSYRKHALSSSIGETLCTDKDDQITDAGSYAFGASKAPASRAHTLSIYKSWSYWHRHAAIKKANYWYTEYILHGVFRRRPLPPSEDGRHITLDVSRSSPLFDERRGHAYIDNHIRSSRYTIWSFIPSQLWFQFTKVANFYFLITGIIQLIPGLSTTGTYTTILPLLFFLSFSIGREGYDDFRRYRLDKTENRRPARVLDGFRVGEKKGIVAKLSVSELVEQVQTRIVARVKKWRAEHRNTGESVPRTSRDSSHSKWKTVTWVDLRVGDVIEIRRDEQIPADIVLLSVDGRNGIAYIETMALDGETNLKSRQPPSMLAKQCTTITDLSNCQAHFVVEDPNLDLYDFNGKVSIDGKTVPLTLSNVVYRGSILRNTKRTIGMIVNTGEECKIRMNATKDPQAKAPAIQSRTNQVVIYLCALVILLSIGCSAGYVIWTRVSERHAWYLADSHIRFADIFIAFAIMYNNLIPLALYVSLEIVKFCQFWLMQDIEMYDEKSDTPFVSNTQTIYENLGQISYIFSDKTGTLTENVMRFRKMSVGGFVWSLGCEGRVDENVLGVAGGKGKEVDMAKVEVTEVEAITSVGSSSKTSWASLAPADDDLEIPPNPEPQITSLEPRAKERATTEMLQYIHAHPGMTSSEWMKLFLLSLALCHTCFPEIGDDGKITYQAESPDELALVEAAQELGFVVASRDSHQISLATPSAGGGNSTEVYEVLDVIEFSTARKRMSILVRFPDSRVCLFTKGADSIMQPKLRNGAAIHETKKASQVIDVEADIEEAEVSAQCHQHINAFATEGLRTLVYGYRFISEPEYTTWSSTYHSATTSLSNRQQKIEEAAELIEQDFTLGGATAIEDKLQDGVPETIEKLQQATIKIWMLTGDKRETAINIAHSARICKPDSTFFILDDTCPETIHSQVSTALTKVTANLAAHTVIVIDGQALTSVEENKLVAKQFYELLLASTSVIVCRASPSQKASMVRSIRTLQPDHLTLAIGDGGNDIAMITEAHVGVGISGREGLQAARVADYSIAQFRFLRRLLLVHGHWSYIRTAKFILYTFWKEMLFYSIQCLYQRWNGYTGTSLFDSWSLTVWNTLFTSLCTIIPGIFEKDLSAETLLERPELYRVGQEGREFGMGSYAWWMGMAGAEAVIVYFLAFYLYGHDLGRVDQGLFSFGDLLFSVCVVFINTKLLFFTYHHLTIIPLFSLTLTISGWWAWNAFLSSISSPSPGPYYIKSSFSDHFGGDLAWWATLGVVVAVVVVLDLAVDVARRRLWPTEVEVWQEREALMRRRGRMEASEVEEGVEEKPGRGMWGRLGSGWKKGKGSGEVGI